MTISSPMSSSTSSLRSIARIVALSLAVVAPAAFAQSDYPSKPVRFLVPFPPGGLSDIVARTVTAKASETLGQPIVVEHRSGAGGTIGVDALAKSAPDGYTIGLCTLTTHTIAPHVYKKVAYDPLADFAPITMLVTAPNLVAVTASFPAKTLPELLTMARERPGTITYATSGVGSMLHLSGEMMKTMTGVNLTHVPYRGSGLAYPDVFAGHVPVVFDSVISALPFIQTGKLRALAVTTKQRSAVLPDVPTMAEAAGLKDYDVNGWQAVCGPAKTPAPIVERLNREINAALRSADVRARMTAAGAEISGSTPQALAETIRRDHASMNRVVRAAMIAAE
jgi:tripartite-type tricarboxylate transporter receptor subunit TctC